jgi:general secretion pathway protein D
MAAPGFTDATHGLTLLHHGGAPIREDPGLAMQRSPHLPPRPVRHRRPWLLRGAAAALSLAMGLASTPGWAAPLAAPAVSLNFVDAEVDSVVRAMSAMLGRPILVDPRVKGKLTLYTEAPVSAAQAQALFAGVLRGLGYAMVESGKLLKVVPEADAKLLAALPAPAAAGEGDQVVTQVIPLVHENANMLVPVLRPLISPNNLINVNAGNNSLVITDYASNLVRLRTLIAALDTPGATDVEVIPLQHALASQIAAQVQRLTDGAGTAPATATGAATGQGSTAATPTAGATTVLADTRLNALLVRAANPARLASIRSLVARLDQPGAAGSGGSNIHVIYLQHVEATRLATVLRAALPSLEQVRGTGASTAPSGSSGGGITAALGGGSGASGVSGSGSSTASSSAVSAAAQPSVGGYIQADPASNALIVTAPLPLFRELSAVVERLDTRRAQLYVESLVVEVDASRALDVGLQWKQLFNITSTTDLSLGMVATALESMAGTNILSTANLVTLDNEEAKIVVGQNVPFVTGSYTLSSSSTSPFQTIERKDVGLTLRIRPQIGANGAIRLAILQESSSVSSTSSTSGPTTNKRAIESTVVVNDGKIIVLGGLIEDSQSTEANQVPWLGGIPYLGAMFRSLSRSRKKTNLVVFLRPRVLADDAATERLATDRYDEIRARQLAQPVSPQALLTQAAPPLLPALEPAQP